jgi:hypothetical protein
MTAPGTPGRGRLRGWLPLVVAAAVIVALAIAKGPPAGGGRPLDPANPKTLGTKGIVEVLRLLGADVRVTRSAPADDATTALLLRDDLDDAGRQRTVAWTRAGGVLVLADPRSPLNPFEPTGGTDVGFVEASIDRRCRLPALRDVGRVTAPGSLVLDAPDGATGCFPRNGGFWLVTAPQGDGTLVVVGGAGAFTNHRLDESDNALLAAALLAPVASSRVAIVVPRPGGAGGQRSLSDLVAPRVKAALWQLAIAFVLVALWRARRLGRPVLEPQPVEVPGSELVVAVGNLLQRSAATDQAAALLRADLRRVLADRLGLPSSAHGDLVAATAAARTGVSTERVLAVLNETPVPGDAELVALAQSIATIRREVVRA